jgi:hypothetical protein
MNYSKLITAISGGLLALSVCAIAPAAYGAERDGERDGKKVALKTDKSDKDQDKSRDEKGGKAHAEWNGPSRTVTLSNLSGVSLQNIDIEIGGKDARDFGQTNDCGDKLDGNKSCTIRVIFHPKSAGAKSATIEVHTTGGSEVIQLSGTGV